MMKYLWMILVILSASSAFGQNAYGPDYLNLHCTSPDPNANTLFNIPPKPGLVPNASPNGNAILYCDAASGTLKASFSGGAYNGIAGSGASIIAPTMAYYFTNACTTSNTGQCFFTPSNTQIANDCNWASTGTTVTCATSHFVSTDVGKRVAGYLMTGSPSNIFGCVAGRTSFSSLTTGSVTIASFTSGTQIALSVNPANSAGSNQGCLIWGTPDDSNASTFETAYSAISSFCPKVMLAAAGYWFSSPHFASQPTGCAALSSLVGASTSFGNLDYTAGFELEGRGPGNTIIYLGPDFPVAGGNQCTNSQGNITNACFLVPVEGKWNDFGINGGGQLNCQVPANANLVGVTVGTLQNITLTNFCNSFGGGQVGIKADALTQIYQVNNSGFGTTCLQTLSNQAYVQAFKLACENSPGITGATNATVDILSGPGNTPTFTCWGCLLLGAIASQGMKVIQVGTGATVRLIGGVLAPCESASGCTTNSVTLASNNGGNLYLDHVTETAVGRENNVVGGVACFASGGKTYIRDSVLDNNSNANYGDTNSGCTVYDLGGNNNILSGQTALNGQVISDGHSLMFSCTGTANASATNSLYGTGPNITSTTCAGQTSTLGLGIPFQQVRTIIGVICTSSATTVSVACTVVVNGTPTSTTCTMTAATRCVNFTTTAVNPADLLSARIVTGAAETGANIKMQVLWQ